MRILILEVRNGSSLVLNGCEVESNKSAIKISPSNKPKSWEMFKMSITNCNLKSTANEKNYGAITSFRFVDEPSQIIDKIGNFNGKIFTFEDKDGMSVGEFTSKKLVFKDGNLLLETDILEDSENNLGDNSEENKQNGPTMKIALDKTTKEGDIPLFENMDTFSVQIAFIMGCYLITYGVMYLLGELAPGMKSVIYGFNFLIGVLVTTGVKKVVFSLEEKGILKKHYINDFMMVRIRNFFYDLMVVAGISAIQISTLGGQVVVLVILCVVGMLATFFYNRFIGYIIFFII